MVSHIEFMCGSSTGCGGCVLLYVRLLTDLLLLVCTFAEEGEEGLIYHLDASVAPLSLQARSAWLASAARTVAAAPVLTS
jgi:hypothetical protein